MKYDFFTVLAKEYGTNSALLLQDIYFWLKLNLKNRVNIIKGTVWTYSTAKDFKRRHDFLTPSQIRTGIDKLIKRGILIKDFLGGGYDRTSWFSIPKDIFLRLLQLEEEVSPSAKNDISNCEKSQMDLLNLTDDIDNNINIYSNKDFKEEITKEKELPPSPSEIETMGAFIKTRLERENPNLLSQILHECGDIFKFLEEFLIPAREKYGDIRIKEFFDRFLKVPPNFPREPIRLRFHRCFFI